MDTFLSHTYLRARRAGPVAVIAVVLSLVAAACGSDGGAGSVSAPGGQPQARPKVALTVFAAASLTDAFTDIGPRFERAHPEATVRFNFGGSSALARQVVSGAPANVLATADEVSLAIAGSAGRLGPIRVFATNRLAVVVRRGNPKGIRSLSDLSRSGLVVVLCAAEVPCGRLGASVLAKAGVDLKPASLEADVKAVVSKVSLGEADAGIAYVTDAMDGRGGNTGSVPGVEGVAIGDEYNGVTRYPAAVVKATDGSGSEGGTELQHAAQAFVDYLAEPATAQVLESFGFGPP